jgi:hypothetical protein
MEYAQEAPKNIAICTKNTARIYKHHQESGRSEASKVKRVYINSLKQVISTHAEIEVFSELSYDPLNTEYSATAEIVALNESNEPILNRNPMARAAESVAELYSHRQGRQNSRHPIPSCRHVGR